MNSRKKIDVRFAVTELKPQKEACFKNACFEVLMKKTEYPISNKELSMTKGGIAARCCFNKSLVHRADFISVPLTTGIPILATAQLDIGYSWQSEIGLLAQLKVEPRKPLFSVLDIGYSVMDRVTASFCVFLRPVKIHKYGAKYA